MQGGWAGGALACGRHEARLARPLHPPLLLPCSSSAARLSPQVEKVPDSTYDMVGGLDQQIKEIKEVGGWVGGWTGAWR